MMSRPFAGGIPGALAVHHVAYTVPDLDQAVAFFVDVLGAELAYWHGPVAFPDSDWMERQLNVHRDATLRLAMLKLGPVTNLELFEYTAPDQCRRIPRNSDWGGHHLALYVTDMEEAVRYLQAQPGVRVLGEPQPLEPGSTRGDQWVYFLTPWGMQLELITMPRGMSYEREVPTRLFQPEEVLSALNRQDG